MKRLQASLAESTATTYSQVAFSYNAENPNGIQPEAMVVEQTQQPVVSNHTSNDKQEEENAFVPPAELCVPQGMVIVSILYCLTLIYFILQINNKGNKWKKIDKCIKN